MASIETGDLHRVLTAFAQSRDRFAITNKSLLVLGDFVAARLSARPQDVDTLVTDTRVVARRFFKDEDAQLIFADVPTFGFVPILREEDSMRLTRRCPNYPRL